MSGFSESIVLKASPEEAFAYLGDPSTATEVDPAVISYEPDSIPMRAGTTSRVRARLGLLPVSMTTRVREWEEGRRMVIETVRPARPFRAVATHVFEPHPDGTIYTWSMEFFSTFPGGGIPAAAASMMMRRAVRAQQRRFKEIMESRQRSGRSA